MTEPTFVILQQPHIALQADQWSEDGFVLHDGQVHRYSIDRKNQCDDVYRAWTPEAFLADPEVPEAARAWLRGLRLTARNDLG